nr:23S rRNA (adenine(2503)-C(2))-methyltransferase RlmN [Lachnospiraceae bacterium]
MLKDIKSLTLEELKEEIKALGEKEFHAIQLYEWMHRKLAGSYEEMTNLSKAFRERLGQEYSFTALRMVREQISKQDGTRKYLFQLADGNLIETVLMKYHHGNSVCISSQV